jgi:hypothetical protein
LLSRAEAGLIARETGRPLQTPADPSLRNKMNPTYIGVPCPFLVDNRCSIYASRPFTCRVHYNMDADNLLCQLIPGESTNVPYLNPQAWHVAYGAALPPSALEFFDIRDFFKP